MLNLLKLFKLIDQGDWIFRCNVYSNYILSHPHSTKYSDCFQVTKLRSRSMRVMLWRSRTTPSSTLALQWPMPGSFASLSHELLTSTRTLHWICYLMSPDQLFETAKWVKASCHRAKSMSFGVSKCWIQILSQYLIDE